MKSPGSHSMPVPDRISVGFTRGNETDPIKMMKRLIDEYDEADPQPEDQAFCMVDSDFVEFAPGTEIYKVMENI